MAREFPEWEMDNDTRARLSGHVTGAMFGAIRDMQTPEDVQALQDRYGKDAVIRAVAGTDDKQSRAWKSARDGLSARRTGRLGIGEKWRSKFRVASRAGRTATIRNRGSLSVTLTASIKTSRTWDRGRKMAADLTGSDLEAYLDALDAGSHEQAAMVVADAYGIDPDVILELADIEGFDTDADPYDD